LVVRTYSGLSGPQLEYTRAGVGRHSFFFEETAERKLQLVAMLRAAQHPSFEKLAGDLIADSDLHTAYRVIRECATHGMVDRLIDRVRDKTAAEQFRQAIKEHRREAFLITRRGVVTDAELRFFLGVLLNAPRRRDILALTRQRMTDVEPARQVATWLRRLSKVTLKLQAEGARWQPNLLGLPEFDDDLEAACVGLLNDHVGYLSERTKAGVAQLRALPALDSLFND